jgi:hypothetical protein
VPVAAPYESARPENDRLMRHLASMSTAFAAAVAVLLVAMSAVLLGLS